VIKAAGIGFGAGLLVAVWAYLHGIEVCEGRTAAAVAHAQREAIEAAEVASRKESERLVAEQAAAGLARELEDLANADQDTASCGLPAGRVLRLNRY